MDWLSSVKKTSWLFVALAMFGYLALGNFVNLVFFAQHWQRPLTSATRGLVEGTLQAGALFILGLGALFWCVGKLRWDDLGLMRAKLLAGIVGTFSVWVLAQLVQLLESGRDFVWAQAWGTHEVGEFLGQALGNALQEEVFFRAFLVSQLFLLLRAGGIQRKVPALIAALIIAQVMFAVSHVPNRIYKGSYDSFDAVWQDQAALFLAGLYFCGFFFLTKNLFFAVGVHALANRPMALIEGANFQVLAEPLLLLLVIAAIYRRRQRSSRVGHATAPGFLGESEQEATLNPEGQASAPRDR